MIAFLSSIAQGGSPSGVTTSAIDTTGASLLVMSVSSYTGGTYPTISDSKSNTWTPLTDRTGGTSLWRETLFYCASPTAGTGHTFSATGSSSFATIAAAAFSGTSGTPFDVENGAGNDSSTTIQPGSVTPSQANSLIISGLTFNAPGDSASINSSFTIGSQVSPVNGQNFGSAIAYKIQTGAAAENPTWTTGSFTLGMSSSIAVFAPAGGTASTISADAGAFTETGVAAGIPVARNTSAGTGSFAETGISATLAVTRKITSAAGSFGETGNAAALPAGRIILAATGAFTETGNAATLAARRLLTSASGAFALTGISATQRAGRVITWSPGAFALAGADASFSVTSANAIGAGVGVFALAGSAAALRTNRVISCAAGSFALSGSLGTLAISRTLTAAFGAFSSTANAANLRAARLVTASSGTLSLSGRAATFSTSGSGAFSPALATGNQCITAAATLF